MYYINNDLYQNTRYDMSKFLNFDTDNFDILDSYLCTQIKSLPYSGAVTIKTQVNRPDLLSYDIYGDTMYWWLIMIYNDLTSPTELEVGKVIVYPSLSDLETLYFTLSTRQKAKDTK